MNKGFALIGIIVAMLIAGVTGAVIENDKDIIKEEQAQ